MEAMSEGEWSYIGGVCTTEEAHFTAQLLGNAPTITELWRAPSWAVPQGQVPGFPMSPRLSVPWEAITARFAIQTLIFSSTSPGDENEYLNLTDTTSPIQETGNGSVLVDSGLIGEHDSLLLSLDMAERTRSHHEA